eukprot:1157239-Pelagomonas_calceolata.AAC.15
MVEPAGIGARELDGEHQAPSHFLDVAAVIAKPRTSVRDFKLEVRVGLTSLTGFRNMLCRGIIAVPVQPLKKGLVRTPYRADAVVRPVVGV